MPLNDNPHSIRLNESLKKHVGVEKANRITEANPLSKSADFNKKFTWAHKICGILEQEFDEDTIKTIRMDCACGPETGKIDKLKKLYQTAKDMDDFVKRANDLKQGFTIEYEQNSLYLFYPTCYCSCVKRVSTSLTKTWCYCTLGYTKKMFSEVLGEEVEVELIESVKMGGNQCRIKIIGKNI